MHYQNGYVAKQVYSPFIMHFIIPEFGLVGFGQAMIQLHVSDQNCIAYQGTTYIRGLTVYIVWNNDINKTNKA